MGYVKVRGVLANPLRRDLKVETEFIADAGAIYTVIPPNIAKKLRLEVTDKRRFKIPVERLLNIQSLRHTSRWRVGASHPWLPLAPRRPDALGRDHA